MTLIASHETTEIWSGTENIIARSLDVLRKISSTYDLCVDSTGPVTILSAQQIREAYVSLEKRGVKVRIIREIIPDNISQAKELSSIAEIRHLGGVIGNFTIADSSDYAGSPETENGILTKLIVSNVNSFVRLQQFFFNTLWEKAVPGNQRIMELEEGRDAEVTEIWRDPSLIVSRSLEILGSLENQYDFCIDWKGPSIIMTLEYVKKAYLDIVSRGGKLRLITEIVPENIVYCKQITGFAEVRHLDSIKGNFGIVDRRIYGGTANTNEKQAHTSYLHSTVREFVDQQQYLFETLWEKAEPAEVRISEIEGGHEPERLELIPDTEKSIALAFDVMNRTEKEFLVLFATSHAFLLATTMDAQRVYRAMSEKGATVRILVPMGEAIEVAVRKVLDFAPKVHVKVTDANLSTRITIMVSDWREFMSWELKDDTISDPYRAGGVATYSNNRSLAESYATIFENLWRIAEFADNLKAANTRLERNDQAMREFIDITAHELRNPIQPILGLSEILHERQNSPDQKDLLDVIVRNAHRLQQLADDVLDVTRFESGRLQIALQRVDVYELVTAIVHDFQRIVQSDRSNGLQILLLDDVQEDHDAGNSPRLIVLADPNRMGQVITNILSNAVKFTSAGMITVRIGRQKSNNGNFETVISISDTGSGIDPSIMDRLFEKFVSRSEKGIGLGLYLSKKIVDAHGGRIWAENNADGVGTTFNVALPISSD